MQEPTVHPDWALIEELGGPTKVAELLNLEKNGGAQRVQNWKHRGIPAAVKVERPELFMPGVKAGASVIGAAGGQPDQSQSVSKA